MARPSAVKRDPFSFVDPAIFAWLAVCTGLIFCLWRHAGFFSPNYEVFAVKQALFPRLYRGDAEILNVMHSGYYLIGAQTLGHLLRWMNIGDLWPPALGALQMAAWTVQLFFFYRWTRRVTDSPATALLATLLFAWRVPLFKLTDAPYFPAVELRRSLSLAAVMPSIYFYFSGRKRAAWMIAALSMYVHGLPGIHLLEIYFLLDMLEAVQRSEKPSKLLKNIGCAMFSAAPIFLSGAKTPQPAPEHAQAGLVALQVFSAVPHYALADWILFFEGIALLLAAQSALKSLPSAPLLNRALLASAAWIAGAVSSRLILYPLSPPWGGFFMKLTASFSYLFLPEMIGIIAVSYCLRHHWENPRIGRFPLLAAGLAFMSSHDSDYLLRLLALGILASGSRSAVQAGAASCSADIIAGLGLAGMALWQINPSGWAWQAARWFHLKGGLFLLPAFQRRTLVLWSAALLIGVLLRSARRFKAFWVLPALLTLNAWWARDARTEKSASDWESVVDWIAARTPINSIFILPASKSHEAYRFMLESDRAAMPLDAEYISLAARHGAGALPLIQRLWEAGFDSECCRKDRPNAERFCAALDSRRAEGLSTEYGLTHWITDKPLPSSEPLEPVYRKGPYTVYKL